MTEQVMGGKLIGDAISALRTMVEIPGGSFLMGSEGFYPEEAPIREIEVSGLAIDRGPVTVGQFTRFVDETGYTTLAERAPDPADYPDADPALLVAGSAVFQPTAGPVRLNDPRRWWAYVPGASWRHPWVRRATTRGGTTILSRMSRTRTLRRSRVGRVNNFPRRPSGSTPPAAA